MRLEVIREGSKGQLVLAWEEFLRDEGSYWVEADGFFDTATAEATKAFQDAAGLKGDGVVGRLTWSKALERGFDVIPDDDESQSGPNWPLPPSTLKPLDAATRDKVFGHIAFEAAPTQSMPEAIRITNDWAKQHIVTVLVPQLAQIRGIVSGGKLVGAGPSSAVHVHEKVARPLEDLFKRWEEAGLMYEIITWAGLWVPRFIKGSRKSLSNHAYGSAFDINAPWNGLRKQPALLGKRGCVRKLVPHANELGWYWGGHFTRRDGMHFEYVSK